MSGGSSRSKVLEGETVLTDTKSIPSVFNNYFAILLVDSPMGYTPQGQLNSLFLELINSMETEIEIRSKLF